MNDLKTTNSDIAICNHYDESKNKTLCKNVSDKRYILKNQEIQEFVIKDKSRAISGKCSSNENCSTSRCQLLRITKTIAFCHIGSKCQTGGLYLPAAVSLPASKSSIVHDLSLNRYYEFFKAEISRYNYYKRSPFRKIAKRMVVKRGIKAAKYVSRNQTSLSKQKEIKAMVSRISKDLKAFSLIGIEKRVSRNAFCFISC